MVALGSIKAVTVQWEANASLALWWLDLGGSVDLLPRTTKSVGSGPCEAPPGPYPVSPLPGSLQNKAIPVPCHCRAPPLSTCCISPWTASLQGISVQSLA